MTSLLLIRNFRAKVISSAGPSNSFQSGDYKAIKYDAHQISAQGESLGASLVLRFLRVVALDVKSNGLSFGLPVAIYAEDLCANLVLASD